MESLRLISVLMKLVNGGMNNNDKDNLKRKLMLLKKRIVVSKLLSN